MSKILRAITLGECFKQKGSKVTSFPMSLIIFYDYFVTFALVFSKK